MVSEFKTARILSRDVAEYHLAVQLDEATVQEVITEQKIFLDAYGMDASMVIRPHIMLAGFNAKEVMESTISRWIQNICNLQNSFVASLNNYSGIPPHTILLRIQDPRPFIQLSMRLSILDGFIQSNDCPPVQLARRPNIVIAAGLTEHTYLHAINCYAQKNFHTSFQVEKLVLFRKQWNGIKTELVNTFNLPHS